MLENVVKRRVCVHQKLALYKSCLLLLLCVKWLWTVTENLWIGRQRVRSRLLEHTEQLGQWYKSFQWCTITQKIKLTCKAGIGVVAQSAADIVNWFESLINSLVSVAVFTFPGESTKYSLGVRLKSALDSWRLLRRVLKHGSAYVGLWLS